MSAAFLLVFLLAGLLALIPVWRLRGAGWPSRWLFGAWVTYGVAILIAMRFSAAGRFVIPILVVAFIAPFVAGPERLTRVLGGRLPGDEPEPERPVIDVTPRPAPKLGPPPPARTGGRGLRANPPGVEDVPDPDEQTAPYDPQERS